MEGAFSAAFSKVALIFLTKSPLGSSFRQRNTGRPLSSMTALAIKDLPTPGSP